MSSNKYEKRISIYTKKNSLDDYLSKDYFRKGFLKWVSKNDPTTIHYMYKLIKDYSLSQQDNNKKIRNEYILPRTQSEPTIRKRPRSRKNINKPILLS